MRVTLLLIIAGLILFGGIQYGKIADHYEYIDRLVTYIMKFNPPKKTCGQDTCPYGRGR